MARILKKIPLLNADKFASQLLVWAQSFQTFFWLDNNQYPQKYASYDKVLAVGVLSELELDYRDAFDQLDKYQREKKDYLFGYLSYDLKNDTEDLVSENYDGLAFPDLYFFQPKKLFFIREGFVELQYDTAFKNEMETDMQQVFSIELKDDQEITDLNIKQRISEREYYRKIDTIQTHIKRGDSYEINFCMEYFAEDSRINPLCVYNRLNAISKAPFAGFFKNNEHYLIAASPERFVRKEGSKLISQPIKGTLKRSDNPTEDKELITQLKNDPKERAENIMIVDLVRNDLSKTARKASVKVEELCEVYTFKQVHQLVSTVTSTVKKEVSPVQILKSLFPMGSMTGAPKISTMKIIEELEETKRGLYSGSVGYFTPTGDFDFNVVIRSILYNAQNKYISFSVGGAITINSNPVSEYQECQLKAAAMKKVLSK